MLNRRKFAGASLLGALGAWLFPRRRIVPSRPKLRRGRILSRMLAGFELRIVEGFERDDIEGVTLKLPDSLIAYYHGKPAEKIVLEANGLTRFEWDDQDATLIGQIVDGEPEILFACDGLRAFYAEAKMEVSYFKIHSPGCSVADLPV